MELEICKAKNSIYYNFSKGAAKHQQLESATAKVFCVWGTEANAYDLNNPGGRLVT